MFASEYHRPQAILVAVLLSLTGIGGTAPAQVSLLDDGFLPGWKKGEPIMRYAANDLYGHIDGGAELFLELGFKELLVQRYTDGRAEIDLEVYGMTAPEAALGIYLSKTAKETKSPNIPARHSAGRYQYQVVRGDYYIQINSFSGDSALVPAMEAIVLKALAKIPEAPPLALLEYLPQAGLIAGSEGIFRGPYGLQPLFTFGPGDIFSQKGIVFGVCGEYKDQKGNRYTHLIIPYTSSGDASAAFRYLFDHLDDQIMVVEKAGDGFVFRDYQKKHGWVKVNGKVIEALFNLIDKPSLGGEY